MRPVSTLFFGLCLVAASIRLATAAPDEPQCCTPSVQITSPVNGPVQVNSPVTVAGTYNNGPCTPAVITIVFKDRVTGMVRAAGQAYGTGGNWTTNINVPAGNYDVVATIIQTGVSDTVTDITVP